MEGTPQLNSPVAPQSPDPITVWQLQASLTDDTSSATDQFGSRLALDGDTLVVGAWRDDEGGTDTGSAYVFVRDGIDWSPQQKLAPSVRANSDYFGLAVDVDEATIIVGAPHQNSSSGNTFPGRAFVFVRSGGAWAEQGLLTALDGAGRDAFGSAVAVDGDRALVGAPWDNTFSGSAYVFNRSEAFWLESGKLTGEGGEFGGSLDLKGGTAIVGSSSGGSHYIFSRSSNGQWVEVDSHQHDHSFNPGVGNWTILCTHGSRAPNSPKTS
jgi:hypothetical protein